MIPRRALNWDLEPLPLPTYASSVTMSGTGTPDPGPAYVKARFACPTYGPDGGILWVTETSSEIPALRTTSSPVLVWLLYDVCPGNPWRILQERYGAGTGSVGATSSAGVHSAATMRAERLAQIQAAFAFALQDLARVLGISRAQLYKWLDHERDIQLHEESRERLKQIEQFASHWRNLSLMPLNTLAHEPLPGGADIVTLMAAPTLNESAVVAALRELATRTASTPKSITEGMRERGFRRRPSARSLPSDA
jgi:hypothetical protein